VKKDIHTNSQRKKV